MSENKCNNFDEEKEQANIIEDSQKNSLESLSKVIPYEDAVSVLKTISDLKDVREEVSACKKEIEELRASLNALQIEAKRKPEKCREPRKDFSGNRKKSLKLQLRLFADWQPS